MMQGKQAKIVSPIQERAILGYLATTRSPARDQVMFLLSINPTATLLEHVLLAQGFMGVSKVASPRRLQLQNRDSTGANLSNAIKCRCRVNWLRVLQLALTSYSI